MDRTTRRLARNSGIKEGVTLPRYRPEAHDTGIVHIGIGAFARAHLAAYTDDALAAAGGDWRIIAASLRSTAIADALNEQNGLYTLLIRDEENLRARIIGSIASVIAASREAPALEQRASNRTRTVALTLKSRSTFLRQIDSDLTQVDLIAALTAPKTRIVSLTITEKAYGIDRTGRIDRHHPAIAADLANRHAPISAIGLIVEALRRRRQRNIAPFTVLCCDNLPANGRLLRAASVDFARQLDPHLADWIEASVAFPSTMVDRITPAPTQTTLQDAEIATGCTDLAAIEAEPFSQWVIEDHFPQGRPAWEAGSAIFAPDVVPYERMKLRMLNGAHSLIAYMGFLSGKIYVRDVMNDLNMAGLVQRHIQAAADTIEPLTAIDFSAYGAILCKRFANPAIAHETYQIAMDGTEKLPQRLIDLAIAALSEGRDISAFAFAVACWMRYCIGRTDDGQSYALRDPREALIRRIVHSSGADAASLYRGLSQLDGLFPAALTENPDWSTQICSHLQSMLERGVAAAIADFARCS